MWNEQLLHLGLANNSSFFVYTRRRVGEYDKERTIRLYTGLF